MQLPRNAQIWLPGYLDNRARSWARKQPKRVWIAITDHYEPFWKNTDEQVASDRVKLWRERWPRVADSITDSAGRRPIYSFFYPEEEYRPHLLESLAEMTHDGIGDVEIHLHHDGEGEQDFVDRMGGFIETLTSRHDLLHRINGRPVFGFIHGNWALDNSRADGQKCGLNNELSLLLKLGCYADFTLPSAPHSTQTRMVNTIYWAVDDPCRSKSHDTGIPFETNPNHPGPALLMIPGPLGIRSTLLGNGDRLAPRVETGEIASYDPPTPTRMKAWIDLSPRIGDDVFIKLYTHGTQERHSSFLLNGALQNLFQWLAAEVKQRDQSLYFASAWDMKLAVEALGRGQDPVAAVCNKAGMNTWASSY